MINKIKTSLIALVLLFAISVNAQNDQASLLLDLKKARASYEIAKQKLENDKKLLDNDAIAQSEYNNTRNQFLSSEVDYQKLILQLISQQSYIIVEKAVKYQDDNGERRVKVVLHSTMEGNQEYLDQFQEHFDIFSPEMRSGKVYNVFTSLINIEDKTIIGSPYEVRIPYIELGKKQTADFRLLRDVESLQIALNYNGRTDAKNIYLEKDASATQVDIISNSFAQEANLGNSASYDLSLERFSNSDDIYHLVVVNLPKQVSHDFVDANSKARLNQLKFNQGESIRKLILRTYLPDRDENGIKIDEPLDFYTLVMSRDEFAKLDPSKTTYTDDEINKMECGKIKLELIPKGVGKLIVRATSLYHEIDEGESLKMTVTVINDGTRELHNIEMESDVPYGWKTTITPDVIPSLAPGKETDVAISINPPKDVTIGAQEVKIKTVAQADNRNVKTEDKTIRIQVNAKTSVALTVIIIMVLLAFVIGIVIFGIRISKR